MTLDNRATGQHKEVLSEYANADHNWRQLLAEGAAHIAEASQPLRKPSFDPPKQVVTVIGEDE